MKPRTEASTHATHLRPTRVAWASRATLLGATLCAGAVQAQTAVEPRKDETVLPAITAKARQEKETATGPVQGYKANRSATATKTDTPIDEVPQSVSVITAEQVQDQASQSLQDALRYTAGVRHEVVGNDNRNDAFTLRGGSLGSTLLDGLRQPLGASAFGWVRDEPYAFERIEVLRGPASVIAGQNGPGGVVNLVSKRPQAEAMREVAVQLGNYKHKQIAADLTGPLDDQGRWLYRLVAVGRDTGTQVDYADEQRSYVRPTLTWKPQAGTSVSAYGEYQKDTVKPTRGFFPVTGTLLDAPHGKIPTNRYIGEPDWDTFGGTRERAGWEIEQQLSDAWSLRHHLRHDRVEGNTRRFLTSWALGFVDADGNRDPNGTYLARGWRTTVESYRVINADLLLEGKLRTGGVQHTVLFGADAVRFKGSRANAGGTAAPLDVYDPVYGNFTPPDISGATPSTAEQRNWGLLLQDQIKLDEHWVLTAGLRRDTAKSTTDGDSQTDKATSKNLGLVWHAGGGFSPYASYSESFEPATGYGTTSDGSLLRPKRGKQWEGGVRWHSPDERLTASAAVYQLKEKNRPTIDPENEDFYVQRGEVTVKGIELEMAARLRQWDLIAQYTHTEAKITSAGIDEVQYLGQQLEGEPENTAGLWAVRRFGDWGPAGLRAGLGVRYVGPVGNGIGTVSVPSVTLFDVLLGYDSGPWRFALNVNNLTDKRYVALCLERGDCTLGSQRKAVATVAYRW